MLQKTSSLIELVSDVLVREATAMQEKVQFAILLAVFALVRNIDSSSFEDRGVSVADIDSLVFTHRAPFAFRSAFIPLLIRVKSLEHISSNILTTVNWHFNFPGITLVCLVVREVCGIIVVSTRDASCINSVNEMVEIILGSIDHGWCLERVALITVEIHLFARNLFFASHKASLLLFLSELVHCFSISRVWISSVSKRCTDSSNTVEVLSENVKGQERHDTT